jgi:hypothetical protein
MWSKAAKPIATLGKVASQAPKKRTAFKLVEGDRNQAVVNLKVDADAQTENHYNQIDDTTQTD